MQENSHIRKFSFSSLITSHCFYRRAEHVAATSRFHVIYNYWPANSIIMMQEHHRPELYAEPRIAGLSLNDNHLLTWRKAVETMRSLSTLHCFLFIAIQTFKFSGRGTRSWKKNWRFEGKRKIFSRILIKRNVSLTYFN